MNSSAKVQAGAPAKNDQPFVTASQLPVWLAACGIALVVLAAYYNSLSGAFVLDDTTSILENRTIEHLWSGLSPPVHAGVGGRPLLNLSFALNYAAGGRSVAGYHGFNIGIHILAGLTLFGLVRRTLLRPALNARFGAAAAPLAFAVALLWALHPLQTESVTYVSQRAESLMGLFYLLTLYCFVRGAESPAARWWFVLAFLACLCGMATKEVMITAPLLVLLYDRTFVAGTFREAWRQRWRFYLGLASTWALIWYFMAGLQERGIGFVHGISWWTYALTECWVIVRYLGLALWPHPLVFDYGEEVLKHAETALPYVLAVTVLTTATVMGLWRRPVLGFMGAWIFVILAPTSSVVPVAGQPMAENRLYLPLAAVIALIVLGAYAFAGRRSLSVFLMFAVAAGYFTVRRNADYQSPFSIWSDTVAKLPDNARAHDSLGNAFDAAGKTKEAILEYAEALRLAPYDSREHYNLGHILAKAGRTEEAMTQYQEALKIKPDYPEASNNLGALLVGSGKMEEALNQYKMVLRSQPNDADVHYNLGKVYSEMNRLDESMEQYNEALKLNPKSVESHDNIGNVLAQMGRFPEAVQHYEEALRIDHDYASAHNNLGIVLMKTGHEAEASQQYQEALRINPNFEDAHRNLGDVFAQMDQVTEAIAQYESALRLKPDDPLAHAHLGAALMQVGNMAEAMEHCQRAVEISPDYAAGHYYLGNIFARMGQMSRAVGEFQQAVQLAPNYAEAHNNLGMALMQTGQLEAAVAHFAEAVRLNPDYANAADNLAEARAALAQRNGRN